MTPDRAEETGPDDLARARRIHEACERFEAAWRTGPRPRIEDHLIEGDSGILPGLLTELIALEVELRRGAGESPSPADYLARFPGGDAEIADAFGGPGAASTVDETVFYPSGLSNADFGGKGLPPGSPLFGQDLGDFELLEEIARGGMGVVYKARKRSLNCLVALKVIQSGTLASEDEKRRFLLEAEAAANLDHPHIVPVYEIDRARGLYFTMKWVDGGSLSRLVPRLVDDPVAAARLVSTVARAVHDAHRKGYLHRDLKPANILVDGQGRPYVTDFGLARKVGDSGSLTGPGTVVGTPSYMAPEQAAGDGGAVGPAADVYGLGAILYELLAGQPPFRSATVMETIVQVLERDPPPPSRVRPGVPPELEAVCLRSLEKSPANRYPSAEALADDLDRSLRGEGVEAMRGGLWPRLRRWTRREPQLVTRLVGLGAIEAITQFNFATSRHRDVPLHLGVSTILAAWAAASVVLQAIARRDRRADAVRPAWAVADVAFLTLILWLFARAGTQAVGSSLVVGYPAVVAASGLWFRVGLVWLATALAEAGFALLVLDAWLRGTLWRADHHPNIVMAAIALTGFVVARQVRRLLALSSYYEHRPSG